MRAIQVHEHFPDSRTTCAAVVTYFPGPELESNLRAIGTIVDSIVVVDNHSTGTSESVLRKIRDVSGVEIIWNPENLGLGAALNQAFHWAKSKGFLWILTFDQDTTPLPGLMSAYQAILQAPPLEPVGCLGSNYADPETGIPRYSAQSWESPHREVDTLITSGTLVPMNVFENIGPFREDLFIDLTDYEFCLRAQGFGFHHYLSLPVGLKHSLGRQSQHHFLGCKWVSYNHSAFRYYYMARNYILLFSMPRNGGRRFGWGLSMLKQSAARVVIFLTSESDKYRKIYAVLLGIWHGLRGRTGPLKSSILK